MYEKCKVQDIRSPYMNITCQMQSLERVLVLVPLVIIIVFGLDKVDHSFEPHMVKLMKVVDELSLGGKQCCPSL